MTITEALQRTLRGRQRPGWQETVAQYLLEPARFWGPGAPRHADKVEAKKRALRERDGLDDAAIVDAVVAMAGKRRRQRPPPVYVTGLGGSGSHWVTGMLGDLPGLAQAGEVYLPQRLLDALAELPLADQACAADAVHLLHGWPRTPDVWASSIVNCAAGVRKLRRHKRLDPAAVGVHLVRDPRDQVLAVTFRKTAFRQYEAPGASDADYLQRMALRNATSFAHAQEVADLIDVRCRYEDLRDDPRAMLREVLRALELAVEEAAIERAVAAHDAERIRAGRGTTTSNLDEGGRARSWRETTDPAQQRTLHMYLVDAVHGQGYPPGDCIGTPLPEHTLPARTLEFAGPPPGPLLQRVDDRWVPLETDGGVVHVDAGVSAMLRIATGGHLGALARCDGDGIQALCLAANADVGDDALRHVAGMHGLRTLDLARTAVTDAGLEHLRDLTGLQQLQLAQTATTAGGRARLAARLPQLTMWV